MISFFSKQGEVRTTNCQLDTGWGMCYKHDECSNWFGSKSLAMCLLQKFSSSGYTLGCYYDPFPPYHLFGDFHHFEANLSVAACVKLCGEDGYMLAGLRWGLLTQTLCFEFHFRDRQYCHCGSVEPPIDLSVGYEMCGDECPPSEWTQEYSADPWAMTMYEPCGKSHYTMVGRAFYQICATFSQIYSTSYTNYAYWECTTDGGPESGQPCVFPFTEIGGWAIQPQ